MWIVAALTANVVGFNCYSMPMHLFAALADGGGGTLEFLHFMYKDIQDGRFIYGRTKPPWSCARLTNLFNHTIHIIVEDQPYSVPSMNQ